MDCEGCGQMLNNRKLDNQYFMHYDCWGYGKYGLEWLRLKKGMFKTQLQILRKGNKQME